MQSVLINSLQYFSKPTLGHDNAAEAVPLQLVHPNGCIQLGLIEKDISPNRTRVDFNNPVVVVSNSNEKFANDMKVKDAIALGLVVFGILNIILTCLLFSNAEVVDPSKVVHEFSKFISYCNFIYDNYFYYR